MVDTGNGAIINVFDLSNEMKRSDSFVILLQNWKSFGAYLGVDDAKLLGLERKFKLGDLDLENIPHEILLIWKAQMGSSANWRMLSDALVKCGVHAIAEALAPPSIETVKFMWQKKLITLEQLLGRDRAEKCFEMIHEKLDKHSNKEAMQLFKPELIPSTRPHHYVPRSLLCYNELDSKLFTSDFVQNHVFVFQGIDKLDLARLSNYQAIEESGNQLDKVTVKFIVLECDEDYDDICEKSKKPVHLIHHANERFFLVKSNKNPEIFRSFLAKEGKIICEQKLISRILLLPPACLLSIADTPGMGKTLLSTNLALEIQKQFPQSVVLFIGFQEFVQHINHNVDSSTSALEALTTFSNPSDPAKLALTEMLKSGSHQLYLFLDGYDEIANDKLSLADSLLKHLLQLQNIKLIVTARPHFRSQVEAISNQFALKLLPFSENNQVHYLTRYWIEEHNAREGEILETFARQCLSALSKTLTDREKAISGIPLQCRILGEVFAKRAKRVLKLNTLSEDEVKPISFFEMYKRLVDLKYESIPASEANLKENYVNAHVYMALELLIPNSMTENFLTILKGFDDYRENTLYSIGLVEKSVHKNAPVFIHRTYAEYLLAEFIVKNLGKHGECLDLFFGEILGEGIFFSNYTEIDSSYNLKKLTTNYSTIAYFIEMHLKEYIEAHSSIDNLLVHAYSKNAILKRADVYHAVGVCCSYDLEHTFDFTIKVISSFIVGRGARNDHFKGLPHLVIKETNNLDLLKRLLEFTKVEFKVPLDFHTLDPWPPFESRTPCSLLHRAVMDGKYSMAVYLKEYYGDKVRDFKYLLHYCVENSTKNSDSMLNDKRHIINMLVSINRDWLEEERRTFAGSCCTPIFENNVHRSLIQCLVDLGANINFRTRRTGCTVLGDRGDKTNYASHVQWAFSNGFILAGEKYGLDDWCSDRLRTTPLMRAIQRFGDVDDEALKLFLKAGLNINEQNRNGDSILFYALRFSKSLDFIQKILEYGADMKHLNQAGKNAAHVLAQLENDEAKQVLSKLKFLASKGFVEFDLKDSRGRTPLDYARTSRNKEVIDFLQDRISSHNLRTSQQIQIDLYFNLTCILLLLLLSILISLDFIHIII